MSWSTPSQCVVTATRNTVPAERGRDRKGTVFMDYRRRVERQPTAWAGFCHIAGESPSMWRDCEVIYISIFGLGITFHHPQPWELVKRRIVVDISAIGDAVNIRLEGE